MKLKSILLMTILFLFLGMTTAFAADWQDEGVPVQPAQTDNTFHITTAEELAWVAMKTNSGTSFSGYTIELMNDIDISAKEWTPIGTENSNFQGDFEGNNHTINGLKIGSESAPVLEYWFGLFGYIYNSSIRNVGVTNIAIYTSGYYIGGLVGYAYDSNIENCYATGNVTGTAHVGGLIGYGYFDYRKDINIISCYVTGDVTGTNLVGGLIGDTYDGNIEHCYATGDVTGTEDVGGLVGNSDSSVINCYATGNVTGTSAVGGLVGYSEGSVINCYATGNVIGTEYVGGLVGRCYSDIENCFWNKSAIHRVDDVKLSSSQKLGVGSGDDGYDIHSKISTEMKNDDFLVHLNEYVKSDEELYSWQINENINEGYPFFSKQYDEDLFWIGNVKEPECVNETDYKITTAEELAWIAKSSMDGYTFKESIIYLMNDIDLVGKQWIPIKNFAGIFDGCGHIISNMTIGTEKYARVYKYNGLFGYCKKATIKNLGMENVTISGSSHTGGIIGYGENSNVYNSYVIGEIYGEGNVGGIIGYGKNSNVINCYVTGNVVGSSYVGGIAGDCYKIENSYSLALVKATGSNVGGICGYADYINNCYSI